MSERGTTRFAPHPGPLPASRGEGEVPATPTARQISPSLRERLDLPPTPTATATPTPTATPAATPCGFGEIVNPKLARFLCNGESARPGYTTFTARVDGPSTTSILVHDRTGLPVWSATNPRKGATVALELVAPRRYTFWTPTPRPEDPLQYPCLANDSNHCGVFVINGNQEPAPSPPPENYAAIQSYQPQRLVQATRTFPSLHRPGKVVGGPLFLAGLTLQGPAVLTQSVEPNPCAKPVVQLDPKGVAADAPLELADGETLWACPTGKGKVTVHVEGYRPLPPSR